MQSVHRLHLTNWLNLARWHEVFTVTCHPHVYPRMHSFRNRLASLLPCVAYLLVQPPIWYQDTATDSERLTFPPMSQ